MQLNVNVNYLFVKSVVFAGSCDNGMLLIMHGSTEKCSYYKRCRGFVGGQNGTYEKLTEIDDYQRRTGTEAWLVVVVFQQQKHFLHLHEQENDL